MSKKGYRITREEEFVDNIIQLCKDSKYVICHEIGTVTEKSHFHLYIEMTPARSKNWGREFKNWRDKHNIKGSEDYSEFRPKKVKEIEGYEYLLKGNSEVEAPKIWSNFLIPEEVTSLHKTYWEKEKLKSVEKSEVVGSEVEVEVTSTSLEVGDSEHVKLAKLQLEIERERTKRKRIGMKVNDSFQKKVEEEFYEKFRNTKWDDTKVVALERWLMSRFHMTGRASLMKWRPVTEYRNYLLYGVAPLLAETYIRKDDRSF